MISKLLQIALFYFLFPILSGYEIGEKISFSARSSHADRGQQWRTIWADMPYYLAPRFSTNEEKVFHAPVLVNSKLGENKTAQELVIDEDRLATFRIDPQVDFRVGLSFDQHRQEIPWITIYDSTMRRALQKLEIVFDHDGYEIVSMNFRSIYGPRIERIDPFHPALRGCKLSYVWNNVQEEDFPLARRVLFSITVGLIVVIFSLVLYFSDKSTLPVRAESSGSGSGTGRSSQRKGAVER